MRYPATRISWRVDILGKLTLLTFAVKRSARAGSGRAYSCERGAPVRPQGAGPSRSRTDAPAKFVPSPGRGARSLLERRSLAPRERSPGADEPEGRNPSG